MFLPIEYERKSHFKLILDETAKKIWIQAPITVPASNAQLQDIQSFFQEMARSLRKPDLELSVVYCWIAWYSRNKFIFEGKKLEPDLAAAKAESVLEAYRRVRKTEASQNDISRKRKKQEWTPPPENVFKVNVDAAVSNKDQMAGLGAVIKDSGGKIVAAGISQAHLRGNVSYAEAEAVQWGLKVTREAELNSVIIETDCLEVAELINNTKGSKTEIFWTIADIRNQRRDYQKVIVQHMSRNRNAYAHSLAKFALGRNSPNVWLNSIPAEVQIVFDVL